MILLKDLLYEMSSQNLLIPRKVEGRMAKYIQSKIKEYKKNNNVGDFDISGLGLTELPASLKDLKIGGSFLCNNNKLKFLTNSPTSVKTDFNCCYNLLESLVGGPTSVGLDFNCMRNKLTSLVGAPNSVVGDFECSENDLNTLVGGPVSVVGDFDCSDNDLNTLVGAPNSVGGYFWCYNRGLKFTKEQVRAVCDVTGKIRV